MASTLYSYLLHAYGVYCANRSLGRDRICSLKIDDRCNRDVYRWFCRIHAAFGDGDAETFKLGLQHSPFGPELRRLIEGRGGQIEPHGQTAHLTVTLSGDDCLFVNQLANAIRQLTSPGRRYTNACWAWICPRTADSLERLAKRLAAFRKGPNAVTLR